jgi:hypothetical protein
MLQLFMLELSEDPNRGQTIPFLLFERLREG